MNGGELQFLMSQLSFHGPILFVCLVGGFVSLIYMNRMSLPAMLTLGGLVLTAFASFLSVGVQLLARTQPASIGKAMMFVGIVGGGLRAIGLGLVVAAAFVGRDAAHRADPYLHDE